VPRKGINGGGTLLLDVWFVMHLTGRLLDDALRPVGLTADEFGMYSLIYSYAPLTQTQIVRWTGMPLTTVAGSIRRIAGRGHIADVPNPDDARSRMIELTDDGVRATLAGAEVLATVTPRLADTLLQNETTMRAALSDLDQGLRRLVDAAPRPYSAADPATASSVGYGGQPLTPAQTAEIRRYIDWIRVRDTSTPGV
jgi:DNA-binding MarR family transcriptional regulator